MKNGSFDKKRVPVSQRHMSQEATINSDGHLLTVTMDGKKIDVPPGTTLLEVADRLNIHIPTLCTHEDLCVVGNCRICVVEVAGFEALQAACAYPVTESVTVNTFSHRIRQARRHMIQLLLAHHDGECHSCSKNGACELAALSAAHGVSDIGFARSEEPELFDNSSSLLVRDMKKCVLCRRCVRACIDMQEVGVMEAVGKGDHIEIDTFGKKTMGEVVCIGCGQCISHCPTAALVNPDETARVWHAIEDPNRHVVLQLSPSARVSLTESLGMAPGTIKCRQLIAMLRALGFDAVFDTQMAASLAVEAQSRLLVSAICDAVHDNDSWTGPVFSSNCSGWVKFMEHFSPAMLKHMSPLKSPEQLLGTFIRSHHGRHFGGDPSAVVSVASVPCASRKFEAESPLHTYHGDRNIDVALTSLELGKMLKESGIGLSGMPDSAFDTLFCTLEPMRFTPYNSMLHQLCGAVYHKITGSRMSSQVKIEYTSPFSISGAYIMKIRVPGVNPVLGGEDSRPLDALEGQTLRFGKCEGTANAKKVLEDIQNGGEFSRCHFIEFLACPDGCFGGGGHPHPTGRQVRQMRKEAFPVSYTLPAAEMSWIQTLHDRCSDATLDESSTAEDFLISYMPRGKFMK